MKKDNNINTNNININNNNTNNNEKRDYRIGFFF